MKHLIVIASIMAPISSMVAMETNTLEIRNRELYTLEKPHITIINQLPINDPNFLNTRIDISDKTRIYTKQSYRPDDSTVTIYSSRGVRFSPCTNKTLKPEHKRLGMNDAENGALIKIYMHGADDRSLHYLVIGKGSLIPFGDTITITAKPNGTIVFTNSDNTLSWKTPITSDPEDKKIIPLVGIPDPGYINVQDINAEKAQKLAPILQANYYLGRILCLKVFLDENQYIKKLLFDCKNNKEYSTIEIMQIYDQLLDNDPNIKTQLTEIFPLDRDEK